MRLFFEPKSVVLVGATDRKGVVGWTVLDNLLLAKDRRKIYPVDPGSASYAIFYYRLVQPSTKGDTIHRFAPFVICCT